MKKLNFDKLMAFEPTVYTEFLNSQGKKVQLCEHPTKGDEAPVLVVFPDEKLAFESDFWDTEDMTAEHGEYEPVLDGTNCVCAFELQ